MDRATSGTPVAALFVAKGGVYFGRPGVDPWDLSRDARLYAGPLPVVAHSPCQRWGRFAEGIPKRPHLKIGDDGGCFKAALHAVRTYGGVLEHPQASYAWEWFGLPPTTESGAWGRPDAYGGRTCRVYQARYGHLAPKPTWLYAVLPHFPKLDYRRSKGTVGVISTYALAHSKLERLKKRARSDRGKSRESLVEGMSKKQREATPPAFAELLIGLARSCEGWTPIAPRTAQAVLA